MKKIIVSMVASVIMLLSIASMASAHGISPTASFECNDKVNQTGVVAFKAILWESESHIIALGPVAYGNIQLKTTTVSADGVYKLNIAKAEVPNGTYKVFNVDLSWDTKQEYVGTVVVDWTGCETVKVTTPPSTTTPPAPSTTVTLPPLKETERSAEQLPVEIGTPLELANTGTNAQNLAAFGIAFVAIGILLSKLSRRYGQEED